MNTQLDKIVQEAAEKLSPFGTHWPKNSEAWVLAKRKWQDKIKCDSAIIRRAIADAVRETGAVEALKQLRQEYVEQATALGAWGDDFKNDTTLIEADAALANLRALTEEKS